MLEALVLSLCSRWWNKTQKKSSNTFKSHKASKEASLECCPDLPHREPELLTTSFMRIHGRGKFYLHHFSVIEDHLAQYLPFYPWFLYYLGWPSYGYTYPLRDLHRYNNLVLPFTPVITHIFTSWILLFEISVFKMTNWSSQLELASHLFSLQCSLWILSPLTQQFPSVPSYLLLSYLASSNDYLFSYSLAQTINFFLPVIYHR